MATESVEVLIDGGKATAAPPLGPALGPLGVNIGQVVAEINKKTDAYKGMQVPVKVTVDRETRAFTIEIGTPPAASLIIKEAGIKKASSHPKNELVADLRIEQVIKVAKMKEDALLGTDLKSRIKEIIGTCRSMGIMVQGMKAEEAIKAVNEGKFDKQILSGKTELSAEELKELDEEKKKLAAEIEKRHTKFTDMGRAILKEMAGKEKNPIAAKMEEVGIPKDIINKLLEEAGLLTKEADKKGAAPAAAKKK
ncbi:50S ribosomal protein L11 [Candidatus Woesearchaeota archaeon]|nr:MAG: 50S ribosomal protein L11, large subunit ribosomal protein L11 [archaeon GW2011_AR4]MBS3130703.1 50S ribosomal protein L11 [Candidatus Woesearchaeota archaeon]HIH38834.1 50S ribosomal protein L11 [Candidatus Woesearchaeota archaeon]HIJ04343.1 50S ribosomal protein L11 [Candidatus Woesearchaeota archaeon]